MQNELANFPGLASMAAAITLNAGKGAYNALCVLELGRGIIADLLWETRADIFGLGAVSQFGELIHHPSKRARHRARHTQRFDFSW